MALQKKIFTLGFDVAPKVLSSSIIQKRNASSEINFLSDSSTAALKKGLGGRSSFSGTVATVFGASGFMGRYVVNRLGKTGSQVIIPYRGDSYDVRHLKLMGDLGQILFMEYHLEDEESIRRAVKYSNTVINLVGRDFETRNFSFEKVHIDGAHRLAAISKEMGVKKFIHVSAMNCDREHDGYILEGGSNYLKTKGEGEKAVRAAFPEATIIRASDTYGQEDRFLRYYAGLWRHQGRLMPLPKGGKDIWKMPVYVGDVAQGIANAVKMPEAVGQTYEAVGPRKYELNELVKWFHRVMRKEGEAGILTYDMKWDPTMALKARMTELLPSWPVNTLTRDKLERESVSDEISGLPTLEDLGVALTKMEDQVPWELRPWRAHNDYQEEVGEFDKPEPPKYIAAN